MRWQHIEAAGAAAASQIIVVPGIFQIQSQQSLQLRLIEGV